MIKLDEHLPINELHVLVKLAKKGNILARQKVILSISKLAVGIANIYCERNKIALDRKSDFIQEAILSIVDAILNFDESSGMKFPNYSVYWMHAKLNRYLSLTRYPVKVPDNMQCDLIKYLHGRPYKYGERTEELSKIKSVRDFVKDPDGEVHNVFDTIPDESECIEDPVDLSEYNLTPMERIVLDMTINQGTDNIVVANKFNLTRERIRQIKHNAVIKIRYNKIPSLGVVVGSKIIKSIKIEGDKLDLVPTERYLWNSTSDVIRDMSVLSSPNEEAPWTSLSTNKQFKFAGQIPKGGLNETSVRKTYEKLDKILGNRIFHEVRMPEYTSVINWEITVPKLLRIGIVNEDGTYKYELNELGKTKIYQNKENLISEVSSIAKTLR